MSAADALRHMDLDIVAFAQYSGGRFGLLAESRRDGSAIGRSDILPGVKGERGGYMQKMQYRALLSGDEGRS
jgi:hypothetical protein